MDIENFFISFNDDFLVVLFYCFFLLTQSKFRVVCECYTLDYPRRARSALGVDIVLTLDVCMFVCYGTALERKRLIGMT